MNNLQQQQLITGMTLRDAMKSEAGQLYHRHVMALLDGYVEKLLAMGLERPDHEIAAIVRQMQGTYKCLDMEWDAIRKGLQIGAKLNDRAKGKESR